METIHWVATLSDGTTAIENQGDFKVVAGLRKPWVRLVAKLESEGKWLTSFRLQVGKKTIHLPRLENHKLADRYEKIYGPKAYSVCYHAELDDILGKRTERHYVDVGAIFDTFAIHYIQELFEGNTSWITVTSPEGLVLSPEKK